MNLTFELLTEHEGRFVYPDSYEHLEQALDLAIDAHESGEISEKGYIAELERLAAEAPEFIDAHAHLGNAWYDQGKPKKALDAYRKGVAAGEGVLPPGFAGRLEWGWLENRPFLRALHGEALAQMRLRRHREAAAVMERMLAINPADNQGIRFIVGSEHLRAGNLEKALEWLTEGAQEYPANHYELALLNLMRGDWVAAATALRRGFVSNSYIAELLCGNPHPLPLAIWHSPHCDPETAKDYVRACGSLWHQSGYAIRFMHWLYNQPQIMRERAQAIACAEALEWTREESKRSEAFAGTLALMDAIDDTGSRELALQRVDRAGRKVWPWLSGR